jgi:hypothetical protein
VCPELISLLLPSSNQEAKDELKKWEICLDNNLVEFDGRLLESEPILYANRSIRYKHDDADWSREGTPLILDNGWTSFSRSRFTTYLV